MIQQLTDKFNNQILVVSTSIEQVDTPTTSYEYIHCVSDVDVYFYTNVYETLSEKDKVQFKLVVADAQKIPELVNNRETREITNKEVARITQIIAEYLAKIAKQFDLVYNKADTLV